MKLEILLRPSGELAHHLRTIPDLSGRSNTLSTAPFFVDSDSSTWGDICRMSRETGHSFQIEMLIPRPASLDSYSWYAPQIRRTIALTDKEFRLWQSANQNARTKPIGERYVRKITDSLVISKKSKRVCDLFGPDSGPYVFLCDGALREHLEHSTLLGLRFLDVFRKPREKLSDCFLLSSDEQFPISYHHISGPRTITNNTIMLKNLIAFVYEIVIIKSMNTDAGFTAEWWCNETSQLLVSKRFRDAANAVKLRGVEFYPVFEYGTTQHADLVNAVDRLQREITSNAANKFLY